MFSLLNRIADGVQPMLDYLQEYIRQQGSQDMMACAETITTVSEICRLAVVRRLVASGLRQTPAAVVS